MKSSLKGGIIGAILIILIFTPAIIATILSNINDCNGDQDCDYNEKCSNLYKYWDADENWFNFFKRGGCCDSPEVFCVEAEHCEALSCSDGMYVHIKREESSADKITWHYCYSNIYKGLDFPNKTFYEGYCLERGLNCKVYNSDGEVIESLTTGDNPNIVDAYKDRFGFLSKYGMIIFVLVLSLFGFLTGSLIGWLVGRMRDKKAESQ